MHYPNGRECKIGDTIIGKTHNSRGLLRLGIVVELMPEQGPCNVRLILLNSYNVGMLFAATTIHVENNRSIKIATGIDYADVKEIAHVEDCYKIYDAIQKYAEWDSSYMVAGGKLDCPKAATATEEGE